mmetsp:Transcript_18861/g.18982  ORF Transcript_18861/g.18982 Transcript_18861/m.18982 type:complete len:376 (+) Transcript_18861:137-1264(+)
MKSLFMKNSFYELTPYISPEWASVLSLIPSSRVRLSQLPTPIHSFNPSDVLSNGVQCLIKRDDLTSFELSGNKVRKLEFLMADAKQRGHDCIVTIGGIQSNHARATAVSARQLGLDPHLILWATDTENDPGIVGNLLFDRMVGANMYLTTGVYDQEGQHKLVDQIVGELRAQGRNPYAIPVGGSSAVGTWGYLEATREISQQLTEMSLKVDHIVFACGSGATALGLGLGVKLAGLPIKVHAMAVCDSAEYFYNHMENLSKEIGVDQSEHGTVRSWVDIHMADGSGYAASSIEELQFIVDVSRRTGLVFDPVYSGKALYYFNKLVESDPSIVKTGETVMFIHTGGTLGLYDKSEQLLPLLTGTTPDVQKMKITTRP